ncbi:YpmS family protein [Lentilactobacillus otakiensis]|uniref:Tat pathway signal sequence domain protein n=1 Tax=Lentilactobacillus otakiensis DSM 19908 = JCM 15040 TaxID=1423780 RepID=S4NAX7_9LACO|nr:YpmS family protein [Lentilactobacillus otakiensis]MBZ3775782.1 YpmS family protein [Lentilactobacillus otakiensis]MDV3519001.1 YpmS family protein [Lentilactobacillus otakiensis]GAD15834.1 tat pathway signal sequence domain protein [Lentilactobacillus otakiensis DSM 19908 = JCM 15040]
MRNASNKSKQRNPWKIAFIALISMLIIAAAGVFLAVSLSSSINKSVNQKSTNTSEPISATINKTQLNQLSNYYLGRLQKGSAAQYHFEVGNEGIVYGSLKLLGSSVDYSLTFDPKVMPNGNIELHANKLALGKFPVPISFVLMYVKQNYKLPKWVQLIPKDKTIKLDIIHMNGDNGINYRARTIDMKGQGKFTFDILLPQTDKED